MTQITLGCQTYTVDDASDFARFLRRFPQLKTISAVAIFNVAARIAKEEGRSAWDAKR